MSQLTLLLLGAGLAGTFLLFYWFLFAPLGDGFLYIAFGLPLLFLMGLAYTYSSSSDESSSDEDDSATAALATAATATFGSSFFS